MEAITIETLKKSKNVVFSHFFSDNALVKDWINSSSLHRAIWHGIQSNNSFCLKPEEEYRSIIPGLLKDKFGINNPSFDRKYYEAISGDGQEWTRITNLNSSSLLALLFFYSVSPENKISIDNCTFDNSYFEVKTHVFDDSESNMDIVLRGKDIDNNPVVLFLESKFSEYLASGAYNDISLKYEQTYDSLGLSRRKIKGVEYKNNGDSICLYPSQDAKVYCGGIKQMISHYLGVNNYAKNRSKSLAKHYSFEANNTEKVMLAEVIFDFGDKIRAAGQKKRSYESAYRSLARAINSSGMSKIKMVTEALTYQRLIYNNPNYKLDEKVKELYMFE